MLAVYTLLLIPFTLSIADITKAKTERPAQLLSVDGKVLAEYRWANREWVALNRISPHVVNALIATEDHRFYEHSGMDSGARRRRWCTRCAAIRRAVPPSRSSWRATCSRRKLVAAHHHPQTQGSDHRLQDRGVVPKDEILETYLNTVPFLYNAYGIEMAARTYLTSRPTSSTCWKAPR